jgi:thiol-disulfide isomerase/thioredoxin
MKTIAVFLAVAVAGVVGAATWYMNDRKDSSQSAAATSLAFEGRMPSMDQASGWLNTEPLTDRSIRGKVVLVEFWTYSCINWRRQLPYVRAWADKYKDKGLVVIGVHTPEFEFEKDITHVRIAAKETNVQFPIALDSEYSIWNAFGNRYWPALYFVDAQGKIRHHQFGEGEYEKSERVIQQLLAEAGSKDIDTNLVSVNPTGAEAEADWNDLYSPENYVGYDRTQKFAYAGGPKLNQAHGYEFPSRLELGDWALSGNWTFGHQATTLNATPGSVRNRFHSRDLHIVMGPGAAGKPVKFRVTLDGKAPGAMHGTDVDEDGNGTITEPGMYQLIRQTKPISDRTLEIEFLDPGIEIFSFTFG